MVCWCCNRFVRTTGGQAQSNTCCWYCCCCHSDKPFLSVSLSLFITVFRNMSLYMSSLLCSIRVRPSTYSDSSSSSRCYLYYDFFSSLAHILYSVPLYYSVLSCYTALCCAFLYLLTFVVPIDHALNLRILCKDIWNHLGRPPESCLCSK